MDNTPVLDLNALALLAQCWNEISNLKARLKEKESENESLLTRVMEIGEQLQGTHAKFEEAQAQQKARLHDKESENDNLRTRVMEIGEQLQGTHAKFEEAQARQKARLHDKESENENLRTRVREIGEQLRETQTKLEEANAQQKALSSSVVHKPLKRARSPSIEFVDSNTQDIQISSKKEHTIEGKKSSDQAEQVVNDMIDTSKSSNSATQLRPSPPTKKRKIAIMNVNQKALERVQDKAVSVRHEETSSGNGSCGPSSSSSGNPDQCCPVPGPSSSISLSSRATRNLSPLLILPNVAVRNAEPSSSAPQISVIKNKAKLQNQLVKQECSENLLGGTQAVVRASSTVVPSTPIPSTSFKTQFQTKTSPRQTKKRKVPKVEEKFILPDIDVKKYLDSCKPLCISPPPLDLEVSRKFLREAYGGSDMNFLQHFKVNPSGNRTRQAVFPRLDLNPSVACRPGEPGLIFASRHEILKNPPWTLFVKMRNETPALWLYLGEYKCTLSGKMTAAQFKAQSDHVQSQWGRQLLKTKEYDVYVAMRARIALRKAGKIPVDDKDTQEALIQEEMNAVKSKSKPTLPVTVEDIVEAFVNGDEGIDIIRMECIEYDHVFASDMNRRMVTYNPTAGKQKREESSEFETETAARSKKAFRQPILARRKRRRLPSEESDLEPTIGRSKRLLSLSSEEMDPQPSSLAGQNGLGRPSENPPVEISSPGSASPSSAPQAEVEGLRRSNRPHFRRFQMEAMLSDSDDEDDSQSLYDALDD